MIPRWSCWGGLPQVPRRRTSRRRNSGLLETEKIRRILDRELLEKPFALQGVPEAAQDFRLVTVPLLGRQEVVGAKQSSVAYVLMAFEQVNTFLKLRS